MTKKAVHATVRGRVQGVGFRFFTEKSASYLGVKGWARNRADGSVEVYAQGPEEAVDAFLEKLREGPRFSHVDDVDVQNADLDGRQIDFEIRG